MKETLPEKVQAILKKIPTAPGVYLMKDSEDEIIYVGKAKNLKNRLKSYFQASANHGVKTEKMVENVMDIDWIEVNSETEALVLETNYIKEHRPKYNILMKDDKSFVYLKINLKEDFPELQIVRQIQKDGAKYFGPKTSKGSLVQALEFLQKIFPVHYCKPKTPGHPCIEYQMHKSLGPCLGNEYKEAYHQYIEKIVDFFEGHYEEILKGLKTEMIQAAQDKRFEKAAKMRDLVQTIENIQNEQIVSNPDEMRSRDIIGVFHDLGKTFVTLFQIRAGKMIHNEQYTLCNEGSFEEMIQAFITEFYTHAADMPREILIPKEVEEKEELENWFEASLKTKVKILAPQRGMKNDLVELAMQNAKSFAERERARWMTDKLRKEQAEKDILVLVNQGIPEDQFHTFPKRMECFDISHFQGEATVASMVVFLNGEEAKSEYRRYKLKTLEAKEIDDFKSMNEVLGRRLLEIENILGFKEQEAIPEGFELKKLKKKEIEALELEGANFKNDYYGLFENEEIQSAIEIKKHDAKTLEVKKQYLISDNPQRDSCSAVADWNDEEELEKIFFSLLFEQLQGKDLWILTEELAKYESFGFKKLKTLEQGWQKDRGLVPESIAQESEKERGYALRIRIPKKEKGNTSLPDFILIDGGKGQLSSVVEAFTEMGWEYKDNAFWTHNHKIIVCSLAKREEEVFFPFESNPRILPNTSEGSYLLQRLRDEAHRFAITYNRDTREKLGTRSELDEIDGIGPVTKKKLLKTFGSVSGVKKANFENLKLCVGESTAKIIQEYFDIQL